MSTPKAIVETLPDGAPRLVETAIGRDGPALVSGVDQAGFAAPAEIVPTPPAIVGGVAIVGPLEPGAEIRLEAGAIAGNPRPSLRARWFLEGRPLAGEVGLAIRVAAEMRGRLLSGELEALNRLGVARQLSAARRVPGDAPPVEGPRPSLTVEIGPEGAAAGAVLTVTRLVLSGGVDEDALFFAWLADGVEVSADRRQLETAGLVPGAVVQLRVTGGGLAVPALSNALVLVAPPPDATGYLREDW